MKKLYALLLLCCSLLPHFVRSQPAGILNYAGSTTGGGCYRIKFYNDQLITGAGNTLMVYSTSPSTGMITNFLCEKRLVSNITDIHMYGTHILVAANHDGIYMFGTGSLPNSLTTEAHYLPDSLTEAAYDLALKGDTVFVAYKRKMAAFRVDTIANTFTLLSRFGQLPASLPDARVRGCDAKGNLVAYTVCGYSTTDAITGVYIVNAAQLNFPQLSFHPQTLADPDDVIFGKNTNLLHVLGGTESYAQLNHPEGLFYSMNITNPSVPVVIYTDTIGKFGVTLPYIQICEPQHGENINDTIYVASLGAPDTLNSTSPAYGHTYVYRAVSTTTVTPLNAIYAGLWHFDVAVHNRKMYVASEWYGIKTVDLTTMATGGTDLGNRLTGGWNKGGDRFGNKLLQANEGYGFRIYDISNPAAPVFLGADSVNQFCWGANFSGDGQYVYGHYYSNNDFRVFNSNTYQLLGGANVIGVTNDPRRSRSWHNKAVSIYHTLIDNIEIIDASNPAAPVFEMNRPCQLAESVDVALDTIGDLFLMRKDSVTVYDLASSTHPRKAWYHMTGNVVLKTIAVWKDTIFAVGDGPTNPTDGIYKFYYDGANTITLLGGPYPLPVAMGTEVPKFAAADSFGVYVVYQQRGLYALAHSNLSQIGYYRHGMEYYRNVDYGPQDIYAKDGMLFLHEYFGQTSMFYTDSSQIVTAVNPSSPAQKESVLLYPDPTSGILNIVLPSHTGELEICVYNAMGELVSKMKTESDKPQINLTELNTGIYFIRITSGNENWQGKIIKD